jgi:hypothetical protein
MSQDEITLVCEGEPRGRDIRWLNLVLGHLAASFEPAGRVRVVPSGSKADLGATVRGMREALRTRRVYAVRDRDFLRNELLAKDEPAGVHSLQRHCLESYLVEPSVLEEVFGLHGAEATLLQMAERRFWPDVGRAVLDAVAYELRRDRPHLGEDEPGDKAEVARIVTSKLQHFRDAHAAKPVDVEAWVERFERDMRSTPVWMRVNGKELMKALAGDLGASIPGGDIEGALFRWCSNASPPGPFVAELKRLVEVLDSTAPA